MYMPTDSEQIPGTGQPPMFPPRRKTRYFIEIVGVDRGEEPHDLIDLSTVNDPIAAIRLSVLNYSELHISDLLAVVEFKPGVPHVRIAGMDQYSVVY